MFWLLFSEERHKCIAHLRCSVHLVVGQTISSNPQADDTRGLQPHHMSLSVCPVCTSVTLLPSRQLRQLDSQVDHAEWPMSVCGCVQDLETRAGLCTLNQKGPAGGVRLPRKVPLPPTTTPVGATNAKPKKSDGQVKSPN